MKKIIVAVFMTILIFVAGANAQETITLSWDQDKVEDVDGWRLYKSNTSGGPYEVAAEIAKTEPMDEYSKSLPKADFTGSVFFIVRAFNEGGESDDSNEVTNIFRPGAPVILRIVLE